MPYPSVLLPGYLAAASDYEPLRQDLEGRGYPTQTVPLQVRSWVPTLGGRAVTPILAALDQTIQAVLKQSGSDKVNLIGHSAGGWIARIYLGSTPYDGRTWQGHPRVATLITLGSPHRSREPWTRTNLDFVNTTYPGAFHPEVNYVCLAGKGIQGHPWNWTSPQWSSWWAYLSYDLTVGDGAVWGDGITPIPAAHLEGALNLTLEKVFHAPRGGRYWYGSPLAVNEWIRYLG